MYIHLQFKTLSHLWEVICQLSVTQVVDFLQQGKKCLECHVCPYTVILLYYVFYHHGDHIMPKFLPHHFS